jgi:uncharacterized protein YecE (DUF72 family)
LQRFWRVSRKPEIRVGISGWRYAPWKGVFYPRGLKAKDELAYAATRFDSIELNGSFYSLQRPEYYRAWRDQTPPGFVFAVKGSRYITHMLKLRSVETPLANFFASGVLSLEAKLGPFLWQFPEALRCDLGRFERFFELLPRDTRAAQRLARKHDARLAHRSSFGAAALRPLRHAVEVRSETCITEAFVALLRRQGIGLVVADTARRFPHIEDVTADFVYVRLHGDEVLYASGYSPQAIDYWARRIESWTQGREPDDARRISSRNPAKRSARDVYVYFDNDVKAHAPFDAIALAKRLGLPGKHGLSEERFGLVPESSLELPPHFNPNASLRIGRRREDRVRQPALASSAATTSRSETKRAISASRSASGGSRRSDEG